MTCEYIFAFSFDSLLPDTSSITASASTQSLSQTPNPQALSLPTSTSVMGADEAQATSIYQLKAA